MCVCVSDVSHMIHIIDTEHPWDVFSINSGHSEVISCLEWDQSGEPSVLLSVEIIIIIVRHCVRVRVHVCRLQASVSRR